MEINMKQLTAVKQVLTDVYEEINWAYLAKNYFGKSRSWLYHKFCGVNNEVEYDFSDIDRNTLKMALEDISFRVQQAANKL